MVECVHSMSVQWHNVAKAFRKSLSSQKVFSTLDLFPFADMTSLRNELVSSLIFHNFRKHSDETEMIWKLEFGLTMILDPLWMAKNVWHGTNWRPPGSFAEFCWCRGASDHSGRQWRWSESPFQIHISLQCSEREPFILN